MTNKILRKLAVTGVVSALAVGLQTSAPQPVEAKETWTLLDKGRTTINSRNSSLYYPYETYLVTRPAELPNHVLVTSTLRVKNVSKAFNQTVYADKSVMYAYRDGKVIYTLKPYKSFSSGLKAHSVKPGKTTPYFTAAYTTSASKFKESAAEYYCLITPIKEGRYGKAREVGLCTDNPKFRK